MKNECYGDFISFGKVIRFNGRYRNHNYSKKEIDRVIESVKQIIYNNVSVFCDNYYERNSEQTLLNGAIISSPFYATMVSDLIKEGFYNSDEGFSYIFDKAIKKYTKKRSNNAFYEIPGLDKYDLYDESINQLKDAIIPQIDRLILQDLLKDIDEDVIVNVANFKKEFFYELPKNVKGFISRSVENPELIKELSYAYEIPVLLTSRSLTKANFAIIDGINNRLSINPSERIMESAAKLRGEHTFELGEDPIYNSKDIKFYASLVDTKDIDRATSSTWYAGLAMFKTEYLYITKGCLPTLGEQIKLYTHLLKSFEDRPVHIRIPDFDGLKSLSYMDEIYTEVAYVRDFSNIFSTNIRAIFKASQIAGKKVSIVIPMLRMGKEVAVWKDIIDGYIGPRPKDDISPLFSIMLETESALIYYEDYRRVDSLIYGLDNYIDEAMEVSKYDDVDFEEFMLQAFPDLQGSHQYYRRNGNRLHHIVEGHILKDPKIFRRLIDKGFKHFSIPLGHVKKAGEVLHKQESTRGKFKGVYAKRIEKEKNNK